MSSSSAQVFPRLQDDQVPDGSRLLLEKVEKGLGFIPNLFAAFSNSPVLLERLRHPGPLNEPDTKSFYGGGERGYVDYPPWAGRGGANE